MEDYLGFKEVLLSNEELSSLYADTSQNTFGCLTNEYLILKNEEEEVVDQFRWSGTKYIRVPFKQIDSRYLGKIKPRNIQQQLAIDMLYNDDITVKLLVGKYGTGKDFLMSAAAIDLLERGKVKTIVYVRNNIEVKDSKPIGHLPGTTDEKLMPYAMVLADKLGGVEGLEMFMKKDQIEISYLGVIRGRDLKNSIIYCSEAENLTREHVQLLISRVGEGSSIWINGDCRQTDLDVFKNNSGIKTAVERLKGHPRFGYVQLLKTERSETAAMADLLD